MDDYSSILQQPLLFCVLDSSSPLWYVNIHDSPYGSGTQHHQPGKQKHHDRTNRGGHI